MNNIYIISTEYNLYIFALKTWNKPCYVGFFGEVFIETNVKSELIFSDVY